MEKKKKLIPKCLKEDAISGLEKIIKITGKRAAFYKGLWNNHKKECPEDTDFADSLYHQMRIYELDVKMDKERLKKFKGMKTNPTEISTELKIRKYFKVFVNFNISPISSFITFKLTAICSKVSNCFVIIFMLH